MGNIEVLKTAKNLRFATWRKAGVAAAFAVFGIVFAPLAFGQDPPASPALTDVQNLATQRTGYAFNVMPTGDPAADKSISWCISQMLAGDLTKDEAVQIALLNNRNLQAELAEIGIANGDLIDAGLLKNPVLDFLYRKSTDPDAVANLDFSVTLDFLSVLTLPMRRQIAQSEFEATKLKVANEILDLAFDVESAYYRMQGAAQMQSMYQKAVAASKASYETAKSIHEAGNITDLALHQQQAAYEMQKLDLAETERDAVELRENLNQLMGLWGTSTDWNIADELPELPKREFQGKGLESIAVYQRLDLAVARQEIETNARELGLQNATHLLPELGGTINAERETDDSWTRGGGVSFPIPLFNQGQGRLKSQRAKLLQARRRYYALAVDIRSDVRKAFGQMRRSRDRAKYYDKIMLPLQKRIVKESHLMYNAMEATPFELLDAKQDEILSKRDRTQALEDYWIARADLQRAMGGSFRCYKCPTAKPSSPSNGSDKKATTAKEGQ